MDVTQIEKLVAYLVPGRLPLPAPGVEQRNWVIRLSTDCPTAWNTEDVSALLTQRATAVFQEARDARGAPFDAHVPLIKLLAVDERHVIMTVTTKRLEEDDVHEYLIAASAGLRALDESAPIDDIQGIPRRFWRILLGG